MGARGRPRAEGPPRTVPPPRGGIGDLTPEESRLMLHELQVHQTELEMQNDELRRAQVELDSARARTFELYDLAPVGLCTLGKQGLVQQANLTAATMLGIPRAALVKQPLSRFILKADQDVYYLHLKKALGSGGHQSCEVRMRMGDGTEFPVRLESVAGEERDGSRLIRVALIAVMARPGA